MWRLLILQFVIQGMLQHTRAIPHTIVHLPAKENGHSLNLNASLEEMAKRSFPQTVGRALGRE